MTPHNKKVALAAVMSAAAFFTVSTGLYWASAQTVVAKGNVERNVRSVPIEAPHIIRDPETRCEYVFFGSGGMYPRMDRNGKQICK